MLNLLAVKAIGQELTQASLKIPDKKEAFILLTILLAGILLRFYRISELPFTHDEFSALIRAAYSTVSDVVRYGVAAGDSHPAGIQLLVFGLVRIFGPEEIAVKMPFLLFGLGSILLAYSIGRNLFGGTTGLIVATFLATLEYTVMYSQIARPYISGLFFSLLMVCCWLPLVLTQNKQKWYWYAGFIFSAAACMYNHYFSGLLVLLVGASGLLWTRGRTLFRYLAACVFVALLYVPHIKISLMHLKAGGLTWLGIPENDFLLDYFKYMFHYSILLIIIVIAILVYGSLNTRWKTCKNKKLALVFISWFLISFLIGFIYSRKVEPVLQYSVLIFSFPFLLLGTFSIVRTGSWIKKVVLVAILMTAIIPTLISGRKYYEVFYNSRYYAIPEEIEKATALHQSDSIAILMAMDKRIIDYNTARTRRPMTHAVHWMDSSLSGYRLIHFLDTLKTSHLVYGFESFAPPENVAIITDHYPGVLKITNYFLGSFYYFSRSGQESIMDTLFFSGNRFEKPEPFWESGNREFLADSLSRSPGHSFTYGSGRAFGPVFSIPLYGLPDVTHTVMDIKVEFLPGTDFEDAILVCSLEDDGFVEFWKGSHLKDFITRKQTWNTAYLSIPFPRPVSKHLELKIYIWNNGDQAFHIDDFEVLLRRGNPYLYGLYDPIPGG